MVRLFAWCLVFGGVGALIAACGTTEPAQTATTGDDTSSSGYGGNPSTAGSTVSTTTGGDPPLVCSGTYTNVPKGACDLLNQDCAPGQTCTPVKSAGVWTTKCNPASGLKGAGKPCQVQSECEEELFCIGSGEFGQCIPICCRTTGEPCGGGACNLEVTFDGTVVPNIYVYMCTYAQQCTLLTENACPAGSECHIEDARQGLASCSPPSDQQVDEGGSCEYLNDCKDMQNCTNEGGMSFCRYYCYKSAGGTGVPGLGGCPAGQECIDVDLGVDDVGVCQPS
jgi:hypothetical protein